MTPTAATLTDRLAHARECGTAADQMISALYAVSQFGYEQVDGRDLDAQAKSMLREFGYPKAIDRSELNEAVFNHAYEIPLSVLVRNGWHVPGESGDTEPEEYEILLSTGGPAVRLHGYFGANDNIRSIDLEVQEWFTPWTEVPSSDSEALEWFAALFFNY